MNAEPPADLLMQNLITPTSYHYIRNHGAVPRLSWEEHRLQVDGLVPTALQLSMGELAAMPTITVPVTLTCDGNRRKELNMIKRGKGFDWGACATSCAVWRGVPLHLVLAKAGVVEADGEKPLWLCFEGADTLAKGTYGTSIPLDWALDPRRDIILAFEMNGERLRPDHGFPVRVLMPGMVGGRSVKWLSKMSVSDAESDSFYHWHDNKVLPPNVDVTTAAIGGWWWRSGYTLYELNVNAVITSPLHNEWIRADNTAASFTIRGFAYSGGGRRISRIEVSIDGGTAWELADFEYPENKEVPRHRTRFWTWCHWIHTVYIWQLLGAKEIIVRAVDQAMNMQPSDRTWNLNGMMNNSWYRVKLHTEVTSSEPRKEELPHSHELQEREQRLALARHEREERKLEALGLCKPQAVGPQPAQPGGAHATVRKPAAYTSELRPAPLGIICSHPVVPGNQFGGWLQPEVDFERERQRVSRFQPTTVEAAARAGKLISRAQLATHNTEHDCWVAINGEVYDLTAYLKDHPGGTAPIMMYAGKDASEIWSHIHSFDAYEVKNWFNIGTLVSSHIIRSFEGERHAEEHHGALKASRWVDTQLIAKEELTHDSYRFTFKLPNGAKLLLPAGQHILLMADVDGQPVSRPYTPISPVTDPAVDSRVSFAIKIYRAASHPSFLAGGVFTQFLEKCKIGETIRMKGPAGHLLYFGKGCFNIDGQSIRANRVSLIAGGSGITPMYQLMQAVLHDPEDCTEIRLLYACHSKNDIMLLKDIEALAAKHSHRLRVSYALSSPPDDDDKPRNCSIGRPNELMMLEQLFPPGPESIALVCGPPPMVIHCCLPNLIKIGFIEETIFEF
jgi:nitrate reductase (NAD(P)H)